MKISILTLFPQMFQGPFDFSIIKRAREKQLIDLSFVNIRDFGIGQHHLVDGTPYGGGAGMVMRPDALCEAISKTREATTKGEEAKVVLLDPQGKKFNQKIAAELAAISHLILVAGRYEGIDERVKENCIDEMISIGDYVLTGGEIPAMAVVDAVARLIPGVIKDLSAAGESFSEQNDNLLEYPHYTKPRIFQKKAVPEILLSGNHARIEKWRKEQALKRTKKYRPDLLRQKLLGRR